MPGPGAESAHTGLGGMRAKRREYAPPLRGGEPPSPSGATAAPPRSACGAASWAARTWASTWRTRSRSAPA
eukprot:8430507-Pyramimonas_sp.AAC.1